VPAKKIHLRSSPRGVYRKRREKKKLGLCHLYEYRRSFHSITPTTSRNEVQGKDVLQSG